MGASQFSYFGSTWGLTYVYSGATGLVIDSWLGYANSNMGAAIATPDLNSDGRADLVLGLPGYDGSGIDNGLVRVLLSNAAVPQSYCTAKLNSLGCAPQMDWAGVASASLANNFHLRAQQVLSYKSGLMFWGYAPAAIPFLGGTLCIQPPLRRGSLQNSGGQSQGDCSGSFDFHFSQTYMQDSGVLPGDTLQAQFWGRDPGFPTPQNVSLTDAIAFYVAP